MQMLNKKNKKNNKTYWGEIPIIKKYNFLEMKKQLLMQFNNKLWWKISQPKTCLTQSTLHTKPNKSNLHKKIYSVISMKLCHRRKFNLPKSQQRRLTYQVETMDQQWLETTLPQRQNGSKNKFLQRRFTKKRISSDNLCSKINKLNYFKT